MSVDKTVLTQMICDFIDNADEILNAEFENISVPDYENSIDGWKCYKSSGVKTFYLKVYNKLEEDAKKYGLIHVKDTGPFKYKVFLNGEEVSKCFAADDINGIVWFHKTNKLNKTYYDKTTGGIATDFKKGNVEIVKIE